MGDSKVEKAATCIVLARLLVQEAWRADSPARALAEWKDEALRDADRTGLHGSPPEELAEFRAAVSESVAFIYETAQRAAADLLQRGSRPAPM